MDKPIHSATTTIPNSQSTSTKPTPPPSLSFKSALQNASNETPPKSLIHIGTISEKHPTVSDLLLSHGELKNSGWDIIHDKVNSTKAYTKIPPGTPIFYNPENKELSWSTENESPPMANRASYKSHLDFPPAQADDYPLPLEAQHVDKKGYQSLGYLNAETPTVSHLLGANTSLSQQKWDILAAPINREKSFKGIPEGAEIFIHSQTGELSWQKRSESHSYVSERISSIAPANISHIETNDNPKNSSLGVISEKQPTVSHLLANSSEYQENIWHLLSSKVNKNKPFGSIPPGTEILINKKTNEIHWPGAEKLVATTGPATQQPSAPKDLTLTPNLTEAVQPYMGKPYEEIDCYDLLVRGLRKMGIPYMGKDGLRNTLTRMATEKGLPENAYLNGEGIVEATGKTVFSNSYFTVNNWKQEASKIYKDMQAHLQKGQILSFSTPTRGHTGIVSQHNDQWTFINSGRMDNHVANATRPQEVGEETLLHEIENWFKVAKKNKESLIVTLGQLEQDKIRSIFL